MARGVGVVPRWLRADIGAPALVLGKALTSRLSRVPAAARSGIYVKPALVAWLLLNGLTLVALVPQDGGGLVSVVVGPSRGLSRRADPGAWARVGAYLRGAMDLPVAALNGSWTSYVFFGGQLAAATVALALAPAFFGPGGGWRGRRAFLLAMGLSLFFWRWPGVTDRNPYNQDESVFIAGALTLQHDPAFWRSVHSTTSGPLVYYPLLLPGLLGMPLDFATARAVGLTMIFASLALWYLALGEFFPEHVARLGALTAWSFSACCVDGEYAHYSSEHAPVLLLSAGLYLSVRAIRTGAGGVGRYLAAGFALGCMPFAKFQAVPAALLVTALVYAAVVTSAAPGRTRRLLAFTAGGVAPFGMVLLSVYAVGAADDFWASYVFWNLDHTSQAGAGPAEELRVFLRMVFGGDPGEGRRSSRYRYPADFPVYFRGCVRAAAATAAVLVASFASRPGGRGVKALVSREARPLTAGLMFLLLPVPVTYSILVTGNVGRSWFDHYQILLVLPIAGALGWLLGVTAAAVGARPRGRLLEGLLCAGFAALAVGPSFHHRVTGGGRNPHLQSAASYRSPSGSAFSRLVLGLASRDRPLAVWGWAPHLHVETQMRQATTLATSEREIKRFRQAAFRQRYLKDLKANRPPIFLDETGPASSTYKDRAVFGHETFPALRDYVRSEYQYVGEFNRIRVYVARPTPRGRSGVGN